MSEVLWAIGGLAIGYLLGYRAACMGIGRRIASSAYFRSRLNELIDRAEKRKP